ncbi:MAG: FAD-dependent hydroxylase [Synechococcales bacterium]|nr:FAD-dependent hydroxylase [Synechococcales bacterium]
MNDAVDMAAIEITAVDIAIVGGGIVGSLMACALEGLGLRVILLEAAVQSAAVARGQAYSINLMSRQIFQDLGLWQELRSQIETYHQVQLSDGHYSGRVTFSPSDIGQETLGYVAEHRVLLAALQKRLQTCQDVQWYWPAQVLATEFQQESALLTVNFGEKIQQFRSRLVIAADGARSPLREQVGIPTYGWQYWQSCVVAFIKPEQFHNHTAYERFQTEGPFAILPLPGNICRIVWTTSRTEADSILKLDKVEFLTALRKRYGDQMGELDLIGEPSVFPVRLLHSSRYVLPRLALIGDAAHCCHPVGGQGINLGIRDAAALAEVIAIAGERGEAFEDLTVLKRYERWRMKENLVILAFTDLLTRAFSNRILPVMIVRRLGLWLLESVQPIKSLTLKLMLGLTGKAPHLKLP